MWGRLKRDLLNSRFLKDIEGNLNLDRVHKYGISDLTVYTYTIPQDKISLAENPLNKSTYRFTGVFQWKERNNVIISKKIILFDNYKNRTSSFEMKKS